MCSECASTKVLHSEMRSSNILYFFFICFIISFANSQSNMNSKKKSSVLSNHLVKSRVNTDPEQDPSRTRMPSVGSWATVSPTETPTEAPSKNSTCSEEESVKQLLVVFNERLGDLRNQIDNAKKELDEFNRDNEELKKAVLLTKPYIYSRYFDEYYKKNTADVNNWTSVNPQTSVNFTIKAYPFKGEARATINGNITSISVAFHRLNASNCEANLNLSFVPAVYYTVSDEEETDVVRVANLKFGQELRYDVFNYERQIVRAENSSSFNFSIYVEPPAVTAYGYSYDGSMTWVIEDYWTKKEAEVEKRVFYQLSPYFYTGPKGYRVQVRMRLNGFDEYQWKGLTAQINFLTGPYDGNLAKSFKHLTRVTFFHPTEAAQHLIKVAVIELTVTKTTYNIPIGAYREIENLLHHNNTLYYQVQIIPA